MVDFMDTLHACMQTSVDALVILGSGLSGCFLPVEYEVVADAGALAVMGHTGRLALLRRHGWTVLLALGRRHRYEGYSVADVQAIVQAGALLGARSLVVTNAAGGLNPRFRSGDVMLIEDHLGTLLGGCSAVAGPGSATARGVSNVDDGAGMFAHALYPAIEARSAMSGIALRRGVYAGVLGPSYETRAEIRMLRRMGADAVGMSTVPEVTAAHLLGMRTVGLSLITNTLTDSARVRLDHLDVVEQGRLAGERMRSAVDACLDVLQGVG